MCNRKVFRLSQLPFEINENVQMPQYMNIFIVALDLLKTIMKADEL